MPEPEKNEGSDEQKVTLSQADFDALKTKAALGEKVEARAVDLEYDTPEQFLSESEFALFQAYEKAGKESGPHKSGEGDDNKPPEPKKAEPGKPDMSGFERQLSANSDLAGNAMVTAQHTEFMLNQQGLPDDKKSPYTEKELRAVIMDPGNQMLVRQTAQKTDGNVWTAADRILAVTGGDNKAAEAGARAEKARQEAAATVDIQPGKTAPGGTGKKTDDEEQAEYAGFIAPDTAPAK
jgi:hypothetical protein